MYIHNLRGERIPAPRVFYRGTNPGSTKHISTGVPSWDSLLFVSSDLAGAKMYGSHITTYMASPQARILYEGTSEFNALSRQLPREQDNVVYLSNLVQSAAQRGYDAVWFKRQSDIGTAVINSSLFMAQHNEEICMNRAQYIQSLFEEDAEEKKEKTKMDKVKGAAKIAGAAGALVGGAFVGKTMARGSARAGIKAGYKAWRDGEDKDK